MNAVSGKDYYWTGHFANCFKGVSWNIMRSIWCFAQVSRKLLSELIIIYASMHFIWNTGQNFVWGWFFSSAIFWAAHPHAFTNFRKLLPELIIIYALHLNTSVLLLFSSISKLCNQFVLKPGWKNNKSFDFYLDVFKVNYG